MRNRGRNRATGRKLAGVAGASDLKHLIVSVTNNGSGVPRYKTAAPHGLSVNDVVIVRDTSNPSFNTQVTISAVPSAFEFDYSSIGFLTGALGGTWALY